MLSRSPVLGALFKLANRIGFRGSINIGFLGVSSVNSGASMRQQVVGLLGSSWGYRQYYTVAIDLI